ncbi:hypothetical protein Tco_1162904 [Tanacetum coccineum]
MYENFNASSSESLDSIFTRLQKIVSQLAILDLGSISFDDLYNNFKIVEQECQRCVSQVQFKFKANVALYFTHMLLSDATIYAFLANQQNRSQVVHEDLEQIHKDDLEEMDLKWQLALLSLKERKFYQRTGKKIIINGSDIAGYDKGPRNQESRPRNQESMPRSQDSSKRTVNVKESSSKAMLAINGVGIRELNKSEFDLANYKRGLASVEEKLVFYKKNEEKLKKEKESNQIKIDNFENASKSLDKLIGSQISDNNRKGVGYNVVPPPPTGLFAPPTIDLSNSGLKEFQQPEFEGYGFKANKGVCENSSNEIKKTTDAPIIEDWVSDCDEDDSEVMVLKSDNVQHKPEQANQPKKVTVLTMSGIVPVSAARPITTAAPKSFVNSVNTAKGKRVTSAVGEQGINAVKSKACWVWRPKLKVLDHVSKNSVSYICKKFMLIQQAESSQLSGYVGFSPSTIVGKLYHTTNGHQFTMSNRHQELASPEQTVSGKDFSNPLIVDSLLKTIWFINAPCFCNEALAIPGKTTTGKELSNPLMAGSLPKTTLPPKLLE